MSNYKPRIESNNLDLTSILATINELPDAGPSVETAEIQLIASDAWYDPASIKYVDAEGIFREETIQADTTIIIPIPGMLYLAAMIEGSPNGNNGNAVILHSYGGEASYIIRGNDTIDVYSSQITP